MRRVWKHVAPYFAYFVIVVSFAVTLSIIHTKTCKTLKESRADTNATLIAILDQFPPNPAVDGIKQLIIARPPVKC